ncbi:MAG: hypothetical protein GWN29_08390 [Gammaproteobacteria bacterium]|nr:hypothetical protein [Gammaproteobacteria bacterium]
MQVDGITIMPGTPSEPLREAALVVKLWRTLTDPAAVTDQSPTRSQSMLSVHVVTPDRVGYVIKPLVKSAEVLPQNILSSVLSIARLVGVSTVCVNADLEHWSAPTAVTDDDNGLGSSGDSPIRFSLAG